MSLKENDIFFETVKETKRGKLKDYETAEERLDDLREEEDDFRLTEEEFETNL